MGTRYEVPHYFSSVVFSSTLHLSASHSVTGQVSHSCNTKGKIIFLYTCILSSVWVTIDGFWIDDRIYWTLWYSEWLHFKLHCYTHAHTSVHSHVFTSRCSVAASNSGRSASSGFPNYLRPLLQTSHSYSSQRLNLSSSLMTDWLTDWLSQSLTNKLTELKSKLKLLN
jgi:hypothetical protein